MNRRNLITYGAALISIAGLRKGALAQSSASRTPRPSFDRLKINGYPMPNLTKPDEMADVCLKAGLDGLDVVVRNGRYIEPANVVRDLPPFVKAIRARALIVNSYTANIYDADTPYAEAIMDTAAQLGLHHYRAGTLYYDRTKPIPPQIDALKPRFAKLVKLLEKYDQNAMLHLYSDPNTVGAAVHDVLPIFREHDPRNLSFHYDAGHAVAGRGINTWQLDMRMLGPYIGGVSVKDPIIAENTGEEAAKYLEEYRSGLVAQCPAAPLGCTGTPGRWRIKWVKLGQGYLDIPVLGAILKEINFHGPFEIQFEYPQADTATVIADYAAAAKLLRTTWAPLGLF